MVKGIETLKAKLLQRIFMKFERKVTALKPEDSLAQVLRLIKETSFSQFSVKEVDGRLRGLLTENGITRWLAHHMDAEIPLADFDDV